MTLHLHHQIDRLKNMILELGNLVESRVEDASRAVLEGDAGLASRVVEGDHEVDMMEVEIEEACLATLALHQPVAADLRYIVAVLKINNELERIADLAVNVAKRTKSLDVNAVEEAPFDLVAEAERVNKMLRSSLEALLRVDPDRADRVRFMDDEVDAIHKGMYKRISGAIRSNPERTDELINLLSVSRNLERIGDHVVNIAEDVIYMARGEILRHQEDLGAGLPHSAEPN